MKYAILSFRGEAPRVTPRALPDNGAQIAMNAKLFTGDLEAFKQFSTAKGLANGSTPVRTIFRLNGAWLSWDEQVDVARGVVAGDTTFRTYLTAPSLYGQPRFTNYSLATTGSEPYPVTTRPLGVPNPESAPTATPGVSSIAPTIDVSDSGDSLTPWVLSTQVGIAGGAAPISLITVDTINGNPPGAYAVDFKGNFTSVPAAAYRDFGTGDSSVVTLASDFRCTVSGGGLMKASWRFQCNSDGSGIVLAVGFPYGGGGGNKLMIGTSSAWNDPAESWVAVESASAVALNTWYRMEASFSANQDGTKTVTVLIRDNSSVLATATATGYFSTGGFHGFGGVTDDSTNEYGTLYDDILVQGSGSITMPVQTATSYVYTFVNDLSQESGPSPASETVLHADGVSITVDTPVAVQSGFSVDYGVVTKRIYRAVTGNIGTVFRFVAEIPLATASYEDTLRDTELGEVLESDVWALPPDDLEGILTLPNGIVAGFAKNQLCLSARNQPHAWPVEYRLNTDTDIVGVGNVDTTVVIGTESFVYVASGNDPAAYSMSKSDVPYACVSKRSFAYLTGIGVVFAGPDGLMAVAGPTQVRNLTENVFTRDQWQALNPSSIFGVAHNDIYWMFYEAGSERGCYGIDMKASGFGVIRMSFHASAVYVDPIEDKLYTVLDWVNEPDDVLLPTPANPPHYVDGATIFEFEGNASVSMTYQYRGKLWLLPHPSWISVFQVKADDYDNLLLRIYGDGVQVEETVVSEETEFTVTDTDLYTRLEYEVIGTSRVRVLQGAEDVQELD